MRAASTTETWMIHLCKTHKEFWSFRPLSKAMTCFKAQSIEKVLKRNCVKKIYKSFSLYIVCYTIDINKKQSMAKQDVHTTTPLWKGVSTHWKINMLICMSSRQRRRCIRHGLFYNLETNFISHMCYKNVWPQQDAIISFLLQWFIFNMRNDKEQLISKEIVCFCYIKLIYYLLMF